MRTPPRPYRGTFGASRPAELGPLALPPAPMPGRDGRRPLKSWRYVLVLAPELMLCAARVRVGPARQAFWALWDREHGELHGRTISGRGDGIVELSPNRLVVTDRDSHIDVRLTEQPGIETICPNGDSYAWTRKQGGIPARGTVTVPNRPGRHVVARAIVDDTAGYHARHTFWRWSAGVGTTEDGRSAAWNLVEGINDPPRGSERTLWIGGLPNEVPAQPFAADLSRVGGLRFTPETTRARDENRLVVRSHYRQPFGTFTGTLPNGAVLLDGLGVMEEHDAHW